MMFWNPNFLHVNRIKCTSQLIDCFVKQTNDQANFNVIFVYAFNDAGGRRQLWEDLEQLMIANVAWISMSDFNCVLNMKDRVGAPIRASECPYFMRCVKRCNMDDMKDTGCFYT